MSLDIWLKNNMVEACDSCDKKIENKEWQYCPFCGNSLNEQLHWQNITHNLSPLWKALDCYEELYNSENKVAKQILPKLKKAYNELIKNRKKYEKYNSSNGWGLVKHAVPWLKELIRNIEIYPDSTIGISK